MKFIHICGKESEIVSKTLLTAFEKANISREDITVMWGKDIYANIPDDMEVTLVLLPDFNDTDSILSVKGLKRIIMPFSSKERLDSNDYEILTYAQEINSADFVAKNLTHHDNISFFELLAFNNIGRIYFDNKKYKCAEEILSCAGILLALDVKFTSVIQSLTDEVKK